MKKENPRLPILIRECEGVEPKVTARYDFGVEKAAIVSGLTDAEVQSSLEELVNFGKTLPKSDESAGL
eukprot:CAMPEP_0175104296 /NCGR_PEP_ID=MMETSP0086_2-20121207/9638_1 /TAXON_ID=136419 /ORGANISM="Unknown Unknown, Strain D1" /LENGTH=67 /DNA_ID=CAMNT_0016379651 /DNA_START=138 /DNA_END=341 /DNA_ORIENTATION=+